LESAPNAGTTVLINLSVSYPNEAEILGGKSYLEFTPDNWATAQRVRIKGRDDCVIDGDKDYYLQCSPAVSADPLFNGMMTPDLRLTNADNEHPGQTYFVCDYQLVGQQVLPSGESHYEYKARLRNGGLG